MKILVIEDDLLTSQTISAMLSNHRYAVEVANDGQAGWDLIESFEYDLIILDVNLPQLDGISVCRRIRKKGLQIPIMLLTGSNSSHEKAIGLDAGADDYMGKPFEEEELVARVRALLRRGSLSTQPILIWGDLKLDPSSCQVVYNGELLTLTPKEYGLLELFLRHSKRVFSCGMILEHLWAFEEMPGEEAVRTHIKGLRQKLKLAGAPHDLIETVYGIGYRLNSAEPTLEESLRKQNISFKKSSQPDSEETEKQKTLDLLDDIWYQSINQIKEKIDVLEQAAVSILNQKPNHELCQRARQEAHILAGTLGTFGFFEATEVVRKIETKLQSSGIASLENTDDLNSLVAILRKKIEQPLQRSTPDPIQNEDEHLLLLIVDTKTYPITDLLIQSKKFGFSVKTTMNLTEARSEILFHQPSIVLFDPLVFSSPDDSSSLLADLNKQISPIPVVLFADQNFLQDHPEFSHLRGQKILQKTNTPLEIFDVLSSVWQQADQTRSKIIIVDDDPIVLAKLGTLLRPWGVQVIMINDPQQCLESLSNTAPDLLVLDIQMPKLNGIQLCQQIRSHPQWDDLPILFLTAHTNTEIISQVFNLGAVDYINKPILGPEFITRIINCLERTRFAKQMMARCKINFPLEEESGGEFSNSFLSTNQQKSYFSLIEQKLTLQFQQESAVVQLALSALRGTDFAELMKAASTYVIQTMDLELCGIFELLSVDNAFLLREGDGWDEGVVGHRLINQNDSIAGLALKSDEPIVIDRDFKKATFNDVTLLQEYGIASGLIVTISLSEQPFGVLGAYAIKERLFSPEEIKFLQITANILSSALEQQRIKASLEQIQTNLELRVAERTAELVAVNQRLQAELKGYRKTSRCNS
jgi:DNA-binding response OmpR family regulator/HPt (histidine-containing phosphotransfer) domain-containing protein